MSRRLQFDDLEQRLALSAVATHPGNLIPAHAAIERAQPTAIDAAMPVMNKGIVHHGEPSIVPRVERANPAVIDAKKPAVIKGTFHGGESSIIPGTDYVAMGGANGKLGKVSFQASMYGEVSGNRLTAGTLHLFNSSGTILADLGPGNLVKSGKTASVKVEFEFYDGTGAYTEADGMAGTVTFQIKQSKAKADPEAFQDFWTGILQGFKMDLDSFLALLADSLFEK
jgi:hypothetical protein